MLPKPNKRQEFTTFAEKIETLSEDQILDQNGQAAIADGEHFHILNNQMVDTSVRS